MWGFIGDGIAFLAKFLAVVVMLLIFAAGGLAAAGGVALWHYLADRNSKDIEEIANLSTSVGVLVAILAAAIAFWSYLGSSSQASKGAMSNLFRDYLRARLDFEMGQAARPVADAKQAAAHGERDSEGGQPMSWDSFYGSGKYHLISMKLYALEEMHNWYDDKLPALRNPLATCRWLVSKRRRTFLNEWRHTIKSHLSGDYEESRMMLITYTDCYSRYFLRFAADHWHRDECFRKYIRIYETGRYRDLRKKGSIMGRLMNSAAADPWDRDDRCRDPEVRKIPLAALDPCQFCGAAEHISAKRPSLPNGKAGAPQTPPQTDGEAPRVGPA